MKIARRRRGAVALLLLLAGASAAAHPAPVAGQQPETPGTTAPDSGPAHVAEEMVVTADRARGALAGSTASVSVLSDDDLRALPAQDLEDALRYLPGFAFVDVDGFGGDPQPVVRGFYGGGETEYLTLLLDGRPLGGMRAGVVNWDLVPLEAVDRIEVVRGGASSLYGDAAVGGVINVITETDPERPAVLDLEAGELGSLRGSGRLSGELGGRAASLFAHARRTEGFRDHARRWSGSARGSLELVDDPDGSLDVSALAHRRSYEEPGPLTGEAMEASRTQSAPFYRFDETEERLYRVAVDGRDIAVPPGRLSGHLTLEHRGEDGVKTLPLSPGIADTKERRTREYRLLGSARVRTDGASIPWNARIVAGTDFSLGTSRRTHFESLQGKRADYRTAAPSRGDPVARGEGTRTSAAAFARMEMRPLPALTVAVGGRVDWLRDDFEPRAPSSGAGETTSHLALSPKAGLNLRYLEGAGQYGHFWASVSRSFRAPTLDQLFDQRPIPVPFPPFEISRSNATLDPQHGTSVEAGIYHRFELLSGGLSAGLTASAYHTSMSDEIDFDLETFRFVNIGRSRHRGVEAGLEVHGPGATRAFVNYTLQDVVSRRGDHQGNQLKAVPRHVVSGGVAATHRSGLSGMVAATGTRGIWLDDANTVELPGYTRVDSRLSYPIGGVRVSVAVSNLLDSAYSTTGFLDPAGSGTAFYHPAAGRTLRLGLGTDVF